MLLACQLLSLGSLAAWNSEGGHKAVATPGGLQVSALAPRDGPSAPTLAPEASAVQQPPGEVALYVSRPSGKLDVTINTEEFVSL